MSHTKALPVPVSTIIDAVSPHTGARAGSMLSLLPAARRIAPEEWQPLATSWDSICGHVVYSPLDIIDQDGVFAVLASSGLGEEAIVCPPLSQREVSAPQGCGSIISRIWSGSACTLRDTLADVDGVDGSRFTDAHLTLMCDRSDPKGIWKNIAPAVYSLKITGCEMMGAEDSPWRAIVLTLDAHPHSEAARRHHDLRRAGFTHSYPDFKAHVSIMYRPTEVQAEAIIAAAAPLVGTWVHFVGEEHCPMSDIVTPLADVKELPLTPGAKHVERIAWSRLTVAMRDGTLERPEAIALSPSATMKGVDFNVSALADFNAELLSWTPELCQWRGPFAHPSVWRSAPMSRPPCHVDVYRDASGLAHYVWEEEGCLVHVAA